MPAIWQVTTVDSEAPTVVATVNFHARFNEYTVRASQLWHSDSNHQWLAEHHSICEH